MLAGGTDRDYGRQFWNINRQGKVYRTSNRETSWLLTETGASTNTKSFKAQLLLLLLVVVVVVVVVAVISPWRNSP
jgi:hypothetical protein